MIDLSFTAGEKISPLGNYEDSLKLSSGILPLLFDLFENSLAQAFAAVDRGEDSVVALRRQTIGVQRAFDLLCSPLARFVFCASGPSRFSSAGEYCERIL